MGIANFETFLIAAIIFILTPGIDTVFILNTSLSQGKKAGIFASLGISVGVFVHTLFAALGLSLLIAQSAMAFMVLKYLGAAYLFYIGVMKLIKRENPLNFDTKIEVQSAPKNFTSGVITNVLNPKVALFFISFFPQFIQSDSVNNPIPFFILGFIYAVLGVIWLCFLSVFAANVSSKLKNNTQTSGWINKISGLVFILMGLKMALSKR